MKCFVADDTVSADIKLETEGASEEGPCGLPPNMYHPRRALKNAINDWLTEFQKSKPAWGPITKPQQVSAFYFCVERSAQSAETKPLQ